MEAAASACARSCAALGREPLPSFNDLVVKAVGARAARASRR